MALSYQVGAQGSVLWAGKAVPRVFPGKVRGVEGSGLEFDVGPDAASEVQIGERVVLTLDGPPVVRVRAKVLNVHGGGLTLETTAYQHLSRREYPRIDAPVTLKWRLKTGGDALSPGAAKALGQWSKPLDDYVNLSVNGIAFTTAYSVPSGARLDLEVGLPGGEASYPVEAEVVRTSEDSPAEEGDPTFQVAVRFVDLSDGLRDTFIEYTIQKQDEVLGISGRPGEEI